MEKNNKQLLSSPPLALEFKHSICLYTTEHTQIAGSIPRERLIRVSEEVEEGSECDDILIEFIWVENRHGVASGVVEGKVEVIILRIALYVPAHWHAMLCDIISVH